MQSFDWAEESAREYELRLSQTPSKQENEEEENVNGLDNEEYPTLALSQNLDLKCPDSGGPANRTRSRKKPTPRRADTSNKLA